MKAYPIELDELFARMVSLENEAVQARQRQVLASRSRPQAKLRWTTWQWDQGCVEEDVDLISVEVGKRCAKGVQQCYMFGTLDRYEEKDIDSVIRYICSLEGAEQVYVPVFSESKLSGSPTTQKRNDVGVTDRSEAPSVRCQEHLGCERPAPRARC